MSLFAPLSLPFARLLVVPCTSSGAGPCTCLSARTVHLFGCPPCISSGALVVDVELPDFELSICSGRYPPFGRLRSPEPFRKNPKANPTSTPNAKPLWRKERSERAICGGVTDVKF
jgi:hypothetical protein